jgi:pilus assembly protein CpaB
VLSTGTKMDPDPNGKPENVAVVTLLVTPEQSEKLALALNQGTIHFVLRNGGDSASEDVRPIDMAELSGIARKPAQTDTTHRKQATAAVKRPDYVVETVANGKVTVTKFPVIPE